MALTGHPGDDGINGVPKEDFPRVCCQSHTNEKTRGGKIILPLKLNPVQTLQGDLAPQDSVSLDLEGA